MNEKKKRKGCKTRFETRKKPAEVKESLVEQLANEEREKNVNFCGAMKHHLMQGLSMIILLRNAIRFLPCFMIRRKLCLR